ADRCIQAVYRQLRQRGESPRGHLGVLCNLILRDKMALDDIRASVTEMMAGGVDTVKGAGTGKVLAGARWGREKVLVRRRRRRRRRKGSGEEEDTPGLSQGARRGRAVPTSPRVSRRLHPVAVTLQRYTTHEVILQGYRIPP
ncbi:CP11A protein, partial [Picathartes gymnocephalus]|nr:CP11A protein [Picathartes gymnocephalus]